MREFEIGMLRVYTSSTSSEKQAVVTMMLAPNNVPVQFQIDSGAECNVLPSDVYVEVTGDPNYEHLQPTKASIIMYNGAREAIVGKCKLYATRNGMKHTVEFNMLRGNYTPILSLESCVALGFLKILDCDKPERVYCSMKSSAVLTKQQVLEQFQDVFTGLGKLETPYRIRVDPNVQPVVHPSRRIPVAIHSALKEKLDEMVADGVIAPVTEATDWVSSMVVVHKPSGALRICIDPKDLNQAIKREHYPLPAIEELTTRLGKAKVFTVLDASNGFWQIPLDNKSSMLTCFNTPFGRFKWLSMPFGLNSAPEVWQRRMHEIFEGLPGTEVMFDDFLIIGRGDTLKQAVIDHDQNLIKFLERARERNLKLKAEKIRFRLQEVPFIGHMLTADGLAPSPEKIKAILEMLTPTDVPSLQRFLGMVNYVSKFVPKLSDHTELLRTLTVKDADWKWLPEHEKAYENLKSLLTSPPVLRYYDVHLPVVLQCDASDTGLGAVLLQEGLPVMYSSRALTATERNYAQIEKELLAIVFAAEKFDKYIRCT